MRELQDKYEGRVRDLQCAGEETERHYLGILEEKKSEIVEMQLKVDSVEKQLKSNKQFLEVKLYFHVFSSLCSECFNVVMVINRLKIHFFKQTNLLFWSSFSVLW